MAADFAGKTALITGAGRGIGRAIALGLGGAGVRVILLARTEGQLDETRALLLEQGVPAQQVRVVPADLADEEQRGHAAATVLTAGRIDILLHNAGGCTWALLLVGIFLSHRLAWPFSRTKLRM